MRPQQVAHCGSCVLCMCVNGTQVRKIFVISVQEMDKFGDSGSMVQEIGSEALHVGMCGTVFNRINLLVQHNLLWPEKSHRFCFSVCDCAVCVTRTGRTRYTR